MKRMLINATQTEEVRVALVDGQRLYDLDIENPAQEQKKSNIYKGTITRVEPSLEAAFVDYGADRHGFLPLKEISREYFNSNASGQGRPNIKELVKEGTQVLIQVDKEERGTKGAALTTFISLAGTYLVLMPNNPRAGGISRRIEGDEREELKDALDQVQVPEGMGLIVRTAGVGKSADELQWDLENLQRRWQLIQQTASSVKAPALVDREGNVIVRAIRDYLRRDIGEIVVDDEGVFNEVREHIALNRADYVSRVKHYNGDVPLFSHYQIESQIESAFHREVKLPSGGAIVIDTAEALTAIDINSAKATKGSDIEETAFQTNLEAADEIARQLRLRDVGGLVVIDFIDMTPVRHQREVENRLREATRQDRARIQIGRISRFGLLEMSRQRLRPSLDESARHICPRCHGDGTIRSVESLTLSVLRLIEEEALKDNTVQVMTQVPVEVGTYLLNEKRSAIASIEQRHEVQVVVVCNPHLDTPNYSVTRLRKDEVIGDLSYRSVRKPEEAAYQPRQQGPAAPARVTLGTTFVPEPSKAVAAPAPAAAATAPVATAAVVSDTKPGLFGRLLGAIKKILGSDEEAVSSDDKPERKRERGGRRRRGGSDRGERGPRDAARQADGRGEGRRDDSRRDERGGKRDDARGNDNRGDRRPKAAEAKTEVRAESQPRAERSDRSDRPERNDRGGRSERGEGRRDQRERQPQVVVDADDNGDIQTLKVTERRPRRNMERRVRMGEDAVVADNSAVAAGIAAAATAQAVAAVVQRQGTLNDEIAESMEVVIPGVAAANAGGDEQGQQPRSRRRRGGRGRGRGQGGNSADPVEARYPEDEAADAAAEAADQNDSGAVVVANDLAVAAPVVAAESLVHVERAESIEAAVVSSGNAASAWVSEEQEQPEAEISAAPEVAEVIMAEAAPAVAVVEPVAVTAEPVVTAEVEAVVVIDAEPAMTAAAVEPVTVVEAEPVAIVVAEPVAVVTEPVVTAAPAAAASIIETAVARGEQLNLLGTLDSSTPAPVSNEAPRSRFGGGAVAAAPMAKPQAVSAPVAETPVVIEKRYGATTESKAAPTSRFGAISAPATKPQSDSNPS
ncbi:MAG: ribonuclease E [Gammaproteobacteria bacterium]|nr:ribonuclease E [Gammaproteobacteria bacterium]